MTDFNICQSIFRDLGPEGESGPDAWLANASVCLAPIALLKRSVTPETSKSSMIPRYTRPEMASIWEAADAIQDLVRDRGACGRCAGGTRGDPEGSRQDHLGQGQRRDLRCGADRRDRTRDQARRHRLPHPSGRDRRARSALRASGHDLLRRARHLSQRPTDPRRRSADRRCRQGAGGAEEARLRAQDDADHRPLPRHSRRAGHLRAEARLRLCRIQPRPRTAGDRPQGSRDLRDLRRRRHLCANRSARGGARRQGDGPDAGADLDPGDSARSSRDVFCHPRRHRLVGRTPRHRDPASAAHRGAGSRGILLRGPERLLGDAAQAQPGAVGKPHRPRPHGARLCDAGDGECRAVARARYLALLGRTHDRARRHRDAGLRAQPARRPRSKSCWSIPRTCRRTSTDSAASCIRSGF